VVAVHKLPFGLRGVCPGEMRWAWRATS